MRFPIRSALGLVLVLSLPASAHAFIADFEIDDGVGTQLDFTVDGPPQWTLVSGSLVYQGMSVDSARFGPGCEASLGDETEITLDGEPFEAKLTAKISRDGQTARITLKDVTNGRTIVLSTDFEGALSFCGSF